MTGANLFKCAVTGAALVALSACGSTPEPPDPQAKSAGGIPLWVAAPNELVGDGAIATTECVLSTGAFNIDKGAALANARLSMAQEISTRVAGLAESHANRVQTPEGVAVAQSFEQTSKQIANETLQGAKLKQLDYVTLQGKSNVCAMAVLDPPATKQFFDQRILASAPNALSQQDKDVLYQEFKARRAQERLANEL